MKAIVTSSIIALVILTAGASQAFPGPGWGEGCQSVGPGYGMQRGGPGYFGPGRGFGGPRGGQRGYGFRANMAGLDLTDEQQSQLYSIRDEYRQKMMNHRDKMHNNRAKIRQLKQQYPMDQAKVQKLARVQGKLLSEKIALRMEKHEKVQQLLTEEQRAKWQDSVQQRQRRFKY